MKPACLAALLLLCAACYADEATTSICWAGDGSVRKTIGDYRVVIDGVISKDDPATKDCRFQVTLKGRRLFEDTAYAIEREQELDLDGDGAPELIFEGYSGGAHCCWTYWFVALGKIPGLIAKIENERGMDFRKGKDGAYDIWTLDGAFDYFDGMCHACTAFPTVVLRLEGGRLRDVSPDFRPDYDEQIAAARNRLDSEDFDAFVVVNRYDDTAKAQYQDAAKDVLAIVFGYLYSGRPALAWKALGEMWPAPDQGRIKKLILETKAKGLLSQLG